MYAPQGILPDIARSFGVAADTVSWVIGAATIGVALGVLPWAMLSDRIGRMQTMRIAIIASLAASVILPLANSFGALVALRLLEGIAIAGVPAIAVTLLAESVSPRALGAAVGSFITGNTLGGLSSRMISATVSDHFGWQLGSLSVTVLAAIVGIIFLVVVQPTKVQPKPVPILRGLWLNLRNPGVMIAVLQAFLLMGSFVSVYNYLTFRLQEPPFNMSLMQVSLIFLTYLAGGVSSRLVWRVVARSNSTRATILSMLLVLAGLALTLLPSLIAVIAGLTLFTAGFFGGHSLASTLGPRRSNEARSVVPPLYNLGAYSGSSLLGWLGGVFFVWVGWGGTVAMVATAAVLVALMTWTYAARNGGARAVDL
jgi:predicted MFS family arabinose efflux permease